MSNAVATNAKKEVMDAISAAKNAGAPKSILNRLRSGASRFGSWVSKKIMGRNNKGNSRFTRMGRSISAHLNRYRFLNRFRPGAATRRGTAAGKAALQRLRNRETVAARGAAADARRAQLAIDYPRPLGTRRSRR